MSVITQEKLDLLDEAIIEGVLEIEYQDKKVKYRSLDEMIKTRNFIESKLNASSNNGDKSTVSVGVFRSGF